MPVVRFCCVSIPYGTKSLLHSVSLFLKAFFLLPCPASVPTTGRLTNITFHLKPVLQAVSLHQSSRSRRNVHTAIHVHFFAVRAHQSSRSATSSRDWAQLRHGPTDQGFQHQCCRRRRGLWGFIEAPFSVVEGLRTGGW